jgi:hypothetical protein
MWRPAGESFRTREIVVGEKPLALANSRIVIIRFSWKLALQEAHTDENSRAG